MRDSQTSGQELLDARQAQLDGYLEEDPARSNIAMADVAALIRRHSVQTRLHE